MRSIRIGAGQGFYGDTPAGALAVAERGNVSYICCDALAELTMAILQRDKMRNPEMGYTRDLPEFVRTLLPECRRQGIKIITNGGGMNPLGAARAVAKMLQQNGAADTRIAVVTGDDLTARLQELSGDGASFENVDSGASFDAVRDRVVFCVAYLGAQAIVSALQQDAQIIITGRVADASLFLAPMVHELGWRWDEHDKLAAGVLLGHLMECSGQSTGGNFSGDWWNVPRLDQIGYPVGEMYEDGTAVLTKPADTGGRVSFDTVKEQLLYEVHDPARYLNPDVIADFTSARLSDDGENRVKITDVRGSSPPPMLKTIAGYLDGWLGVAQIGYSWPGAREKAETAAQLILKIAGDAGLIPSEQRIEMHGVNALHDRAAPIPQEMNEIVLRVAGRFNDQDDADRFARIAVPLALNGPPFIGATPPPQPGRALLGVWPSLVERKLVQPEVEIFTARDFS